MVLRRTNTPVPHWGIKLPSTANLSELITIPRHPLLGSIMPPDLNSLPPSRSSSSSSSLPHRNHPIPSPGTAPAPVNPTATSPRPPRRPSTGRVSISERRRSVASNMSLNPNDPPVAVSGNHGDNPWSDHRTSIGQAYRTASPTSHAGSPVFATADPHHQRAPSLGEIHQELEQEQEAQVNRLLQMIRSQQAQLHQLQQNQQHSASNTAVVDDNAPSERSPSFSLPMPPPLTHGSRLSISSLSNRRSSSRPPSQTASPNLRPQDASRQSEGTESFPALRDSTSRRGSRDEGAYYQAEAAMLSRENQMLRQRVRELERQIGDLTTSTRPAASSPVAATPAQEGAETADLQPLRSVEGKD